MLVTLLATLMVVGCAGEDNLSSMARMGSAAVFHTESEAKPLPLAARVIGILLGSLKSPLCPCVLIAVPASS